MSSRSLLYVFFAAILGLSVLSSIAIRADHADVPIAVSAEAIEPLQKGDPAPRFIVKALDGEAVDFNPATLERAVILLTFRGGWCPYCNMYLSDMRDAIPAIAEMGIDVIFLSGDRSELLFSSLKDETQEAIAGLGYTILSDADAQAAIALGIAFHAAQSSIERRLAKGNDIAGSSMTNRGVLPVPSVFAIDKSGVIQFAYTNADYSVRLPADELMAVASEIAAAD